MRIARTAAFFGSYAPTEKSMCLKVVAFLDVRQQLHQPTHVVALGHVVDRALLVDRARRQHVVGRLVVLQGDAELGQVVQALRPPGGLPRGLNGRQQQRDQNADDRDHHQQLHQRKPACDDGRLAAGFVTARLASEAMFQSCVS